MNKLIRIHLTSIHELKNLFNHLAEGLCEALQLPFVIEPGYFAIKEQIRFFPSKMPESEVQPYIMSISRTFAQEGHVIRVERNLSYWSEDELNDAEVKLSLIKNRDQEFIHISGTDREGIFFQGVRILSQGMDEEASQTVFKLLLQKLDYKVVKVV
ncbi:MAG: hypothetical protein OHK0053_09510 [Microscillaceae bacterium]